MKNNRAPNICATAPKRSVPLLTPLLPQLHRYQQQIKELERELQALKSEVCRNTELKAENQRIQEELE